MNWDNLNNRLRKDAEGQNNDFDFDSIWNAIEPQVDEINIEKKKKRRAIFFWWGTGILLLSVGLWFLGNQFSQKENIAQTTDNQKVTSDLKTTSNKNTAALNENTTVIPQDNLGKKEGNNQSDAPLNNGITNRNSKSNLSKNKNRVAKNKSDSNPPISTNQEVILENKTPTENLFPIVKSENDKEESILQSPPTQKKQSKIKEEIFNISSLISWLDFSKEKFSLENEKKVWFPTPKKKRNFSIGIYGGVNYTHRTLAEKRDSTNIVLQNRETYETPLETSQVGINFSYKILNKEKYNVEITTGLQLTSIAERYKNYTSDIIEKQVEGVEFLSYGLGTTPTEIMGLVTQTKTTEYRKEIFNTYRLIDIPVLISYNRSFGEKWEAGIQGGIFANLALRTKGIIPSAELFDIDLASEELDIFKSNVGVSYHLGLNFKRKLSQQWEVNFSPAVRYFNNDFANDNYDLSQKYVLFGGNVGVNYRF